MATAKARIVLHGQVQAIRQAKGARSLVCGAGMVSLVTLAHRDHPFLFLRERTSCRSGGILSVETARERAWERNASARLADRGLRQRIQGEVSASEPDWCAEAVRELQPVSQRTRRSRYHAFQDWQALHQVLERMTGATHERPDLGLELDCDRDCVLRSSGETGVQIEDCEASSPFLHQFYCSGSRQFDHHAPISRSGYHSR